MKPYISVFDSIGEERMRISIPDGRVFVPRDGGYVWRERDPRKVRCEEGMDGQLLDFVYDAYGLNGELISHYDVCGRGGDAVRRIELPSGESWWDVVDPEEARDQRCAEARRILADEFDRKFPEEVDVDDVGWKAALLLKGAH